MRKLSRVSFLLAMMAFIAAPATAQMPMPDMADTQDVTIQGTIVDLSCKLVYDLSGEEMHRECAQVCADRGIPLGILAADGTFYLPVSSAMPGNGANDMLRPHAEHTVTVTGKRLVRAGMPSIIIESVSME